MKTVILAGGLGTRLSEKTENIPKPMVKIGGQPILWHLMNYYAHFGHKDFVLALGYKAEIIKDYFLNYYQLSSDFSVDLSKGTIEYHHNQKMDWKVTLVDTGINTMTGGRLKRLKEYLKDDPFMLTYGDGLSNVDLHALLHFHKKQKKMVTVTAVHPTARFGEIQISNSGQVQSFKEKPHTAQSWINGGFFVMEPAFLDLIQDDTTVLEAQPLEQAAQSGELVAYQHEDFWQCMDTLRDLNQLEQLVAQRKAPWMLWK